MRAIVLSAVIALAACGADHPAGDAGPGSAHDAGPALDCFAVDTSCPDSPPYAGAPCRGTLHCDYSADARCKPEQWVLDCMDGAWVENIHCVTPGGPVTFESCHDPSTASVAGATVRLLQPTGAPFTDGQTVPIIFGSQGGAMVEYIVDLDGADPMAAPHCMTITQHVELDGHPAQVDLPIVLRCGQSLRTRAILPDRPCEVRPYTVRLEVSVSGVPGSAGVDLVVMGGMCPR